MGAEPTVMEAFEALAAAMHRDVMKKPGDSAPIVLWSVKPVLELAAKSFPRADDRRQAKAALKMVCAELGVEHE